MSEVEYRPLEGIEECRDASRLQDRIWGEGFSERVPASLLLVLPRVGSVAIGAWAPSDGLQRLVGLVFGVTGVEGGEVVHWSDILGVDPEWRDRGIGRRLKEAQRDAAIRAGARRMYWTFDPLQARNGWVNVRHLGVTARRYEVEMYGASDSELHSQLGTDRLIAEWDLRAARDVPPEVGEAEAVHGGSRPSPAPQAFAVVRDPVSGHAGPPASWSPESGSIMQIESGHTRIPIPADIQTIKREAPELALRWREATRAAFLTAFEGGSRIVGIERTVWGGLAYRVAPDSEPDLQPAEESGELPA